MTVAELVEHDDITTICVELRRQIRDDFAAARERAAAWDLPDLPAELVAP